MSTGEPTVASGPVTTMHAVTVKLPPFWPADPALWFVNIEAQFALCGITAQQTKYYHVIAAFDQQEASEVRDIIISPPATDPYDHIKQALLRRTTASEEERLQQLLTSEVLSDRKPSQLLCRMQQLLGDRASQLDESFLRQLFLQRLPNTVRMILTTSSAVSVAALAERADKVMEVLHPPSLLPSRALLLKRRRALLPSRHPRSTVCAQKFLSCPRLSQRHFNALEAPARYEETVHGVVLPDEQPHPWQVKACAGTTALLVTEPDTAARHARFRETAAPTTNGD